MDKRLFWIWSAMRQRCQNPNNKSYANYGGRGISVCERWESFKRFAMDIGPRPPGLLLDRIDNNEGYSPSNCKWSTRKEQNSNRRYCIMVDDRNENITLKEYCRRYGLRYRPIVKRIQDRNWPIDLALSVPVGSGKVFQRVPNG